MELIKKNIIIILIILALIVLVLFRSFGTRHFRYDAKRWAEPSFSASNIVTSDKIALLKGKILIIALGNEQKPDIGIGGKVLSVPPDSILAKKYSKAIRLNEGPVILFSTDYSVASRIWMILSQAGFRNIFIYSPVSDNEVLKKEFRSDSLTRPE
jgi:hypothetical protein